MNKSWKELSKGFIQENPTFSLLLGMCPTLGVTSSAPNGLAMGLATTAVLLGSNAVIALLKNLIPDQVRIPAFIVIIASFVTIIQMTMEAYLPALYETLGIFIPLIVVNCIILGRAEAFAAKNSVWLSVMDALGMGAGFTFALTLLGSVREWLGNGTWFDIPLWPQGEPTILVFVLAPGGFILLGLIIGLINKLKEKPNLKTVAVSGGHSHG